MHQTNVDITFCVIVDVLANGQWIDWTFGQPGGVTRPVWTHPVSLGTGSRQKTGLTGSVISGRQPSGRGLSMSRPVNQNQHGFCGT